MSKRIRVTQEMARQIRLSVDNDEMDVSNLAVFETVVINTDPISQRGLFNGAVVSPSVLDEMAAIVNARGGAVPLQIMHETQYLPIGKVFQAKVYRRADGKYEIRALFYLPSDRMSLISDIENSVIDEVSVGLFNNHGYCSECGFDYFGEEASMANVYALTCNEGHTIGKDGVHLKLSGVKSWSELSLVNRGAAKNAKILSRAKQVMSQDAVQRLAASTTIELEARYLTASAKLMDNESENNLEGDSKMDIEKLTASIQAKADEVAEKKVELKLANEKVVALEATVASVKSELATATTEIETLKSAQGKDQAELVARAEAAEKALKDATEKLAPHVKAALVASGVAEDQVPTDLVAMTKLVEEKGLKLHQIVGAEGSDKGAETDKLSAKADYRSAAFKTRK